MLQMMIANEMVARVSRTKAIHAFLVIQNIRILVFYFIIAFSLLNRIHHRHTSSLHALARHRYCIRRVGVSVREVADGTATVCLVGTGVAGVPRRARERRTRVGRNNGRLRALLSTRDRCACDFGVGFATHGAHLVWWLARSAAVAVAGVLAVLLHQCFSVMRQEHTHLVAVVHLIVLLYEVVHITLRTMVRKMTSITHARGAAGMFVVARVVALVGRTH